MHLPSYELRKELNLEPLIVKYKREEKIMEFDDKLIKKIKKTNVFMFRDFFKIFEEGFNIGTCGLCVRYLSYLFDDFIIIEKGRCNILIGTKGAPMGQHSWLLVNGYIYDTTLMIKIREDIAYNEFGYEPYKQMTSRKIMKDNLYVVQKKLAKDKTISKWTRNLTKELKENNLKCPSLGIK